MEYVKVKYWRSRGVIIDGQDAGVTNRVLAVVEGRHRFTLTPPNNFQPESQIKVVRNTTRARPMIVEFQHESQ